MTLTFVPKMIVVLVAASPTTSLSARCSSPDMMKWRPREDAEFFRLQRERRATLQ